MREANNVSYKELSRRLEGQGLQASERVLINRFNRGRFSLAFALQVAAALGVATIEVPTPPSRSR
jgi:hypothetical protein